MKVVQVKKNYQIGLPIETLKHLELREGDQLGTYLVKCATILKSTIHLEEVI